MVRKVTRKRRPTDYNEHHTKHLLTGHDFFARGFGDDIEAMTAAWGILRDDLLKSWVLDHPGTRPYAWWKFDAPERRRRIDGRPHPFDNPERKAKMDRVAGLPDTHDSYREQTYQLVRGKPNVLLVADDFEAVYETEADYLERHDLLVEGE